MHYLKFLCAKEIVFFFLTKGVFMFRSIKWFAQDSTAIGGKSLDLWPPYLLNSIFVSFKSSKCNEHESMNTTETAISVQFSSVAQFSSVQSLSHVRLCTTPWIAQHARPLCPSPTPGVHSNSRPSSQWCHPVISSSVIPFSSCPQSLPASESSSESTLRMRWPKYWSFSFSIIPSKEHPGLNPLGWTDLL